MLQMYHTIKRLVCSVILLGISVYYSYGRRFNVNGIFTVDISTDVYELQDSSYISYISNNGTVYLEGAKIAFVPKGYIGLETQPYSCIILISEKNYDDGSFLCCDEDWGDVDEEFKKEIIQRVKDDVFIWKLKSTVSFDNTTVNTYPAIRWNYMRTGSRSDTYVSWYLLHNSSQYANICCSYSVCDKDRFPKYLAQTLSSFNWISPVYKRKKVWAYILEILGGIGSVLLISVLIGRSVRIGKAASSGNVSCTSEEVESPVALAMNLSKDNREGAVPNEDIPPPLPKHKSETNRVDEELEQEFGNAEAKVGLPSLADEEAVEKASYECSHAALPEPGAIDGSSIKESLWKRNSLNLKKRCVSLWVKLKTIKINLSTVCVISLIFTIFNFLLLISLYCKIISQEESIKSVSYTVDSINQTIDDMEYSVERIENAVNQLDDNISDVEGWINNAESNVIMEISDLLY